MRPNRSPVPTKLVEIQRDSKERPEPRVASSNLATAAFAEFLRLLLHLLEQFRKRVVAEHGCRDSLVGKRDSGKMGIESARA